MRSLHRYLAFDRVRWPQPSVRLRFPTRHPRPPQAPEPRPPNPRRAWREVAAVFQWGRLFGRAPTLVGQTESPSVVVLIPGLRAPQYSMTPLRRYLRFRGHDARHWGLGTNRGTPEDDVLYMMPRIQRIAHETGRRVSLVGWSLGGVIAREIARERPDVVERVVTYGTPVVGGPTYTLAAETWGEARCRDLARVTAEREAARPIHVPITVIFSRADRIVAWPACIDRVSPRAEHVEVGSSHSGMGLDPDVWRAVTEAIERPAER